MKGLSLLVFLCSAAISWGGGKTQSSDYYIHIEFPAHFEIDPLSHEGERKWWAKYDDPESGLSISTDSYGYISEWNLLETIPGGWDGDVGAIYGAGKTVEEVIANDAESKTIKDYFLSVVLPEGYEVKEFTHYVRYRVSNDDQVDVYYFNKSDSDAIFGHCYETLSFTFPAGSYAQQQEVVSQVIESARPWLSRNFSKEDSADRQAGISKAKSKVDELPQPEVRDGIWTVPFRYWSGCSPIVEGTEGFNFLCEVNELGAKVPEQQEGPLRFRTGTLKVLEILYADVEKFPAIENLKELRVEGCEKLQIGDKVIVFVNAEAYEGGYVIDCHRGTNCLIGHRLSKVGEDRFDADLNRVLLELVKRNLPLVETLAGEELRALSVLDSAGLLEAMIRSVEMEEMESEFSGKD